MELSWHVLNMKCIDSCELCLLVFCARVKNISYKVHFCIVKSHILILTSIYINVIQNFKLSTFLCYQDTSCTVVGIV